MYVRGFSENFINVSTDSSEEREEEEELGVREEEKVGVQDRKGD